jgi:hypothetical protein
MVILLALLAAAGLAWLLGMDDPEAPARIVNAAANWLPAHRRDWGRAMAAELPQIYGRARRWQFTASVLRVVLFPPPRHRHRVVAVCLTGLGVTAGATVAAASEVPSLSVFVAVLGLLLCGYATAVVSRSPCPRRTAPRALVGAVALVGVTAAVVAVVRIMAAHPAATTGHSHVFSALFALILTGYLAFALTPPRLGRHTNTVLWWALGGALASAAVWTAAALTTPVTIDVITGYLWPAGATATLAASIGASLSTRKMLAGTQAGLLTAVLGAPVHFAVDMTAILHLQHYALTNAYDLAAYSHSGYPDVASYILSDAVGGGILTGLMLYPLFLIALALLGAAAGIRLHWLATRPTSLTT